MKGSWIAVLFAALLVIGAAIGILLAPTATLEAL